MSDRESPSTVLGIETATATVGVALVNGHAVIASRCEEAPGDHAARLAALVDDVLAEAGLTPNEVGRVAVSTGPGSFTGLRIGIGFSQGFAFGVRAEIVGVPTFPAWAAAVGAPRVAVCVDARRGEVYLGLYEVEGGRARAVAPERVTTPEEAAEAVAGAFGGASFTLVGDGPAAHPEAFASATSRADASDRRPTGEAVAVYGAGASPGDGPVLPCYLRASEAERKLALTLGKPNR